MTIKKTALTKVAAAAPLTGKAALFAAIKPKTLPSGIEGFSIRQLSVGEVDCIRTTMKAAPGDASFALHMLAASVVDADGAAVMTEADIPELQASSNDIIEKMTGLALELNGFVKAAEAKN